AEGVGSRQYATSACALSIVLVAVTYHAGCRAAIADAAACASPVDAKSPKHVAPEPDMRASDAPLAMSADNVTSIAGASSRAGASRSLRVSASQDDNPPGPGNAGNGGFSRLASVRKIAGVDTAMPGLASTI